MTKDLQGYSWPFVGAFALHSILVLAAIFAARMVWQPTPQTAMGPAIDAVAVDSRLLNAAQARKAAAADAQARRAAERAEQQQRDQQAREQAQADAAAQAQRAEMAEHAREQAAAQQRLATEKAALDAAKSAAVKLAAQKIATQKLQLAQQQRVQASAAAQAVAQQRAAAARTAANAAAHEHDEALRAARESELQRQMAAEEKLSALQNGPLQRSYIASLQNRITRAWLKPETARAGIVCSIEVTQIAGGEVTHVHVTHCNGDEAVRQSIENAVYRASPLPEPPDPALFQRNLTLVFKPNE